MATESREVSLAVIGARLREAREAAGLSVEQVALKMRLSAGQIRALEAGRMAELPPAPYVRGYVRSYAQIVGIESGELGTLAPSALPAMTVMVEETVEPPVRRGGAMGPALYVLAAVVVVFLGLWWHGAHKSGTGSQAAGKVKPLSARGGLPPRLQSLAVPGKTVGELSRFPLGQRPSGRAQAQARPAPKKAAPAAVPNPAGLVSLKTGPKAARAAVATGPQETLTVSATQSDCWLAVWDAHNQQLAYELLQKGQTVQMAGTPPFRVSFGNPVGIHVVLDGHAVALPKDAQPGQVLHLQVGSQPG